MGTEIPYLDDTLRTVAGCTKCSIGCVHCWSIKDTEALIRRIPKYRTLFAGLVKDHNWTGKVITLPDNLDQPLHKHKPRRIGVDFYADLFHPAVPDEWIDRVFAVMALCPQHRFHVLTKRAARMRDYMVRLSKSIEPLEKCARDMGYTFKFEWPDRSRMGSVLSFPFTMVRLGVSVCNQQEADERIPLLLQTPAAFRWLSIEPMLEGINLDGLWGYPGSADSDQLAHWPINWVVCGCESGPGRRPMPWSWAERVVEQCKTAGVPCYVKQLQEQVTCPECQGRGYLNYSANLSDPCHYCGSRKVVSGTVIYPGDPAWPAFAKQVQP